MGNTLVDGYTKAYCIEKISYWEGVVENTATLSPLWQSLMNLQTPQDIRNRGHQVIAAYKRKVAEWDSISSQS